MTWRSWDSDNEYGASLSDADGYTTHAGSRSLTLFSLLIPALYDSRTFSRSAGLKELATRSTMFP